MTEDQNKQPLVLVLDDDPDLRAMLVLVLQRAGYEVAEAANVTEALDIAWNTIPDLVLVDIMMPGADGLNFVSVFRATASPEVRDVPIVALSSLDLAEWREKAREAGCNEFIAKPIMPDELIEVVRRYTS